MPIPLTYDNICANRVVDCFPEPFDGGGVFCSTPMQSAPWILDDENVISPDVLDLVYFTNRSGEKFPSPLLKRLADKDGGELSQQSVNTLGQVIMELYGDMFTKQWATLRLQYNPIENYRMTETETSEGVTAYGKTRTASSRRTHDKTGTVTTTPDTQETVTASTSNTTAGDTVDKVAGFNTTTLTTRGGQETSEESSGTETRSTALSGEEEVEYSLHDVDVDSATNADSGRDTQTGERTLERSGNIGVTTSQQMLESERHLWQWNYVEEVVFPAVDEVLTMKIY